MSGKRIFEAFLNSYDGNWLLIPFDIIWSLFKSFLGERSILALIFALVCAIFVYILIAYFVVCFTNGVVECIRRYKKYGSEERRQKELDRICKEYTSSSVKRSILEYERVNNDDDEDMRLDPNNKAMMEGFYESLKNGPIG